MEVHHHGAIGVTRVPDPQYPPATTYLHLAHLTIVMPPPPESNERPGDYSQLPVSGHALTAPGLRVARSRSVASHGLACLSNVAHQAEPFRRTSSESRQRGHRGHRGCPPSGDARQVSANRSAASKHGSRLADAMPQSRTAATRALSGVDWARWLVAGGMLICSAPAGGVASDIGGPPGR